ncbi:hypothetical protein CAY62_04845 [Photobacterium damselae subsp. damselae]|nr:hypothetical protein CAY62_04845 [Photobacterium damselae subsp. damselae]
MVHYRDLAVYIRFAESNAKKMRYISKIKKSVTLIPFLKKVKLTSLIKQKIVEKIECFKQLH